MTILEFIAVIGAVCTLVVAVYSFAAAPPGYQDENGFHVDASPADDDSLLENPS